MTYRSDKRLYVNADRSKVVDEGSAEAAYLLVTEGGELPDEDAKRYDLTGKKAAVAEPEPEPVAEPEIESKQVEAPPENKAKKMRGKKAE